MGKSGINHHSCLQNAIFPNALCHHLWETLSWGPYLRDMSITDILETDAYFHALARRFL
jgi:hypothetical protein